MKMLNMTDEIKNGLKDIIFEKRKTLSPNFLDVEVVRGELTENSTGYRIRVEFYYGLKIAYVTYSYAHEAGRWGIARDFMD